MAHLGNGWASCSMRSGRYTYRKVVVHTTNPDHLIPSAATPSDMPPLQVALRYREGRLPWSGPLIPRQHTLTMASTLLCFATA
jgi:hypothetical protein